MKQLLFPYLHFNCWHIHRGTCMCVRFFGFVVYVATAFAKKQICNFTFYTAVAKHLIRHKNHLLTYRRSCCISDLLMWSLTIITCNKLWMSYLLLSFIFVHLSLLRWNICILHFQIVVMDSLTFDTHFQKFYTYFFFSFTFCLKLRYLLRSIVFDGIL